MRKVTMQKYLIYISVIVVSALVGFALSGQVTKTAPAEVPELAKDEHNLFEYVLLGDIEKLGAALASGSDVDVTNSTGETLLHIAASLGNLSIVETLLANGADVNAKNAHERTPLSVAVVADDLPVMKSLIEAGALTSETITLEGESVTLFDVAVANGSLDAAMLLDPQEAKLVKDELTLIKKGLELTDAAKIGDTKLIHRLVQKGADLEFRDENLWVPLIHAAANGHAEAALGLINLGADVNSKDVNDLTALHAATLGNHVDVVRVLLEAGADQSILVEEKFTAYDLAQAQGFLALASVLEKPENKNIPEDVFALIKSGDVGLLMSLFKSNRQLMTKPDNSGWTPLMHAIQAGRNEIAVHILRETNNEVNRHTKDGTTPILIASMQGNNFIALELLKHGAALEQSLRGVTIPEIAAKMGHRELSDQLNDELKEQTKNLQRELNLFGMVPGPWDGILGDGTRKAIEAVHKKHTDTATMTHKELTDWLNNKNRKGLHYCNHSKRENLYFAVAYSSSATDGVVSHGWYKVGRFECHTHYIPGNNITAYVYAEGNGGRWGSGESTFCVHKRNAFEIAHPTECKEEGYEKRPFFKYAFNGSQRRVARMVE